MRIRRWRPAGRDAGEVRQDRRGGDGGAKDHGSGSPELHGEKREEQGQEGRALGSVTW